MQPIRCDIKTYLDSEKSLKNFHSLLSTLEVRIGWFGGRRYFLKSSIQLEEKSVILTGSVSYNDLILYAHQLAGTKFPKEQLIEKKIFRKTKTFEQIKKQLDYLNKREDNQLDNALFIFQWLTSLKRIANIFFDRKGCINNLHRLTPRIEFADALVVSHNSRSEFTNGLSNTSWKEVATFLRCLRKNKGKYLKKFLINILFTPNRIRAADFIFDHFRDNNLVDSLLKKDREFHFPLNKEVTAHSKLIAHGIEGGKGGVKNLLNIMLEGMIRGKARDQVPYSGIMNGKDPSSCSGPHGPYYVILNYPPSNDKNKGCCTYDESDFLAYLVPSEDHRKVLEMCLSKALEENFLTEMEVQNFKRSILTYEDFLKIPRESVGNPEAFKEAMKQ